ncbi:MAG TPA: signal peptidase I [Candidatus Dormibacteraeota bacterium]|jgi:signal peptidase I|nr:signal peptidase I [Candidatus Dormibacteraeota bacterium]
MLLHRPWWLAALSVAAAGALATRGMRRVQVLGSSMEPGLLPGDHLLLLRLGRVRRGDVVALRHPRDRDTVVVKRVAALPGEAVTCEGAVLRAGTGYVVLGDNLGASHDSRRFGAVPAPLVLGRCVYRYWPEARRGRLA